MEALTKSNKAMWERTNELLMVGFVWLISYFSPTYPVILLIGFFVVGDTIIGIKSAKKLGTLDHKVSKRFRLALDKFIVYGVVILIAHVMEREFLFDFPALNLISGYLVFIELKSIDENLETITGFSVLGFVIDKMNRPKKKMKNQEDEI